MQKHINLLFMLPYNRSYDNNPAIKWEWTNPAAILSAIVLIQGHGALYFSKVAQKVK